MEGQYLTVDEAAVYVRVHPETIRRWLKDGRLKGCKFGTAWRTTKEWLDEFGQVSQQEARPSQAELERRSRAALDRISQKYGWHVDNEPEKPARKKRSSRTAR